MAPGTRLWYRRLSRYALLTHCASVSDSPRSRPRLASAAVDRGVEDGHHRARRKRNRHRGRWPDRHPHASLPYNLANPLGDVVAR